MTRFTKTLALSATLGLAGGSAALGDALFRPLAPDRADLRDMQWEKRPVLLFAPDAQEEAYATQMDALKAAADGLRERDIVVLSDTAPEARGALRADLGGEGFLFVLVGKDGGVKLRSDTPVTTETLFATIDRMPMRQREMKE